MTKVGTICSLFYIPHKEQTPIKKLVLDEKGTLQDKHYNKDINRSVLLTSKCSYSLAEHNGIKISYGSLGENILMDYNPYQLEAGSKLKIGSVVLELVQPCTLCMGLADVHKMLPQLLKNDRGVFAKVVKAGELGEGDNIYRLD